MFPLGIGEFKEKMPLRNVQSGLACTEVVVRASMSAGQRMQLSEGSCRETGMGRDECSSPCAHCEGRL